MGNPDLSPDPHRGLAIFPAAEPEQRQRGEWWLVVAAILLAAAMVAIAFAVR